MSTKWWVERKFPLGGKTVAASGVVFDCDRCLADDRAARLAGEYCEMLGLSIDAARIRRMNGRRIYGIARRHIKVGVLCGKYKRAEGPING